MLTIDFDRLGVDAGSTVLDIGRGTGRHTREAHRRGATAIAPDLDEIALKGIDRCSIAIRAEGTRLPLPDESVTHVVLSEVLEHVPTSPSTTTRPPPRHSDPSRAISAGPPCLTATSQPALAVPDQRKRSPASPFEITRLSVHVDGLVKR